MPAKPRQAIKQTLQSVMNELEKAGSKIIPIAEMFEEQHPEHYAVLCGFIQYCADLKGAVQQFSDSI